MNGFYVYVKLMYLDNQDFYGFFFYLIENFYVYCI